jgi:circadian clock protein KaiB
MKKKSGKKTAGEGGEDLVDLRLYVTDRTPRCLRAYENLMKICKEHVRGNYRITVIDLLENPDQARTDNITAIPTLVRVPRTPGHRKIIGMLTDTAKVLDGLDLNAKNGLHGAGSSARQPVPAQ